VEQLKLSFTAGGNIKWYHREFKYATQDVLCWCKDYFELKINEKPPPFQKKKALCPVLPHLPKREI
jgi:hypothetical protein